MPLPHRLSHRQFPWGFKGRWTWGLGDKAPHFQAGTTFGHDPAQGPVADNLQKHPFIGFAHGSQQSRRRKRATEGRGGSGIGAVDGSSVSTVSVVLATKILACLLAIIARMSLSLTDNQLPDDYTTKTPQRVYDDGLHHPLVSCGMSPGQSSIGFRCIVPRGGPIDTPGDLGDKFLGGYPVV